MSKARKADKAAKHEAKGDNFLEKGKIKKALKHYRKALECDPDRPGIYDKLIGARDQIPGEWKMTDFVESVSWAMKKQELKHPPIKQVHAKLAPEWKEAAELSARIMTTDDEKEEKELIEKLVGMGEIATRALAGMIVDIKRAARRKDEGRDA